MQVQQFGVNIEHFGINTVNKVNRLDSNIMELRSNTINQHYRILWIQVAHYSCRLNLSWQLKFKRESL